MLTVSHVYYLAALLLAAAAWLNLRERHYGNALFWGILAAVFAGGDAVLSAHQAGNRWPAQCVGVGMLVLALLAGTGRLRRVEAATGELAERRASANRLGHRLFGPALLIAVITGALALGGKWLKIGDIALLSAQNSTLVALAIACSIALIAALRVTRAPVSRALSEHRRLLDTMGWAAVLPMLLAALGAVFLSTGVGDAIAAVTTAVIPVDSRVACVLAYAVGMLVFTMIMGNAFAAFPVMTGGIALPLLIGSHGADAAALGALGMLSGYCGTLLTPMAANFNMVPSALLELKNPYGVILAQWPTALALFAANIAFMLLFAFR
ncbi:MAG: DUF979 family protein [Tahibacter sp.]